nr:hypothetical protein [Tanacetum cinerariifolium]
MCVVNVSGYQHDYNTNKIPDYRYSTNVVDLFPLRSCKIKGLDNVQTFNTPYGMERICRIDIWEDRLNRNKLKIVQNNIVYLASVAPTEKISAGFAQKKEDERQGKEKVELRDEISATRQKEFPAGWELDMIVAWQKVLPPGWRMIIDTLSLVLEYLKDLEECMDDGDSRVTKEMKLFDAVEHKSVVIKVGNQKLAIFIKAPHRAFGEPFMRMNLTMFEEVNGVIDLLEKVGSSSEEVVKIRKANPNKGYNINKLTPPPSLKLEEIPSASTIPPQPIYYPLTLKQREKMKEVLNIRYKELEESKPIHEVLEKYVIYKKKLDEILIGKERINKNEFSKEDKVGIIEHVLDILVDLELPLLLGRPFLSTCGAIIDMVRGEDDWLGNFEVGRDEDETRSMVKLHHQFLISRRIWKGCWQWRAMKDMEHTRRLMAMEIGMLEKLQGYIAKPLIAKYEKRNKKNTITYSLQPVSNGNWKWKDLPSMDRHTYCERNEHILTLLEFAVTLGLFMEDKVNYRLFGVHFEESRGVNLAWIIADHLYKHASGTKESSVICASHYVTNIASSSGYCVDDEIKKCSEPIDCEYWTTKMLAEKLDEKNQCLLKETEIPTQAGIGSNEQRQEPRGNFAYPTYEPPNVPPYPYPYIPYPHSYMHYLNSGNQSNQGESYGLGGDDYFTSAMPDFGGNSSRYAVGGSSRRVGFNDEDMDK